jgi:hypothetical protein
MIASAREQELKAPTLHFSLVSLWLVLGFALVGTMLALVGWRLVTQIWFGSGIGLALLLLPDIIRSRQEPLVLPPQDEAEAAD